MSQAITDFPTTTKLKTRWLILAALLLGLVSWVGFDLFVPHQTKRRLSVVIPNFCRCPERQKNAHHLRVAILSGDVKRRVALIINNFK